MSIETGGSAFPFGNPTHGGDNGMTLRDYLAAKAMQGFLIGEATLKISDTGPEWLATTAKAAYEMADAMLEARNA